MDKYNEDYDYDFHFYMLDTLSFEGNNAIYMLHICNGER